MFKHFNEVDEDYKKSNLHMHSTFTDGRNSIEEMVERAIDMGLNTIAMTDHTDLYGDYFEPYFKNLEEIKKSHSNIKILTGGEARICSFKGDLDYPSRIKTNFDILIASVHRFSFNDKIFKINQFEKEIGFEIEKLLCLEAINKGGFDILGHCGGMSIKYFNEFPFSHFEDIIKACTEKNIAFEINCKYHSKIYAQLKDLLTKYNPLVTYGSDAHSCDEIKFGTLS